MEYQPSDWRNHLPNSYHVWKKIIIELMIIWTVTIDVYEDIPYKYMERRDEMLPVLEILYGESSTVNIDSPNNDAPCLVDTPQSSPTPPPPYQKVSTVGLQFQEENKK